MSRRSSRIARASEVDPAPESKYLEEHSEPEPSEEMADYEPEPEPKPEPVELELEQPIKEEVTEEVKSRPGEGIEVKTKFPVARIKRIMQADEDVGKVAQVTPIAVCTCLFPLFPDVDLLLTRNSQSIGTLHDLPRHQSRQRSQRPQFQTRHRVAFETRRCQGRGSRLSGRYHRQGPGPTQSETG